MHSVSANYTLPTMLNTLRPVAASLLQKPAAKAAAAASTTGSTSGSSSSSSSSSAGGLASTFLSLLSQELQNQDPTAPVDSTAMVGQMISLNQLDQLISINQGINGASSASSTGSASTQATGAAATNAALASTNGVTGLLSPSVAGAATGQLPFDPNTLMPLGAGNSSALAATINSSLNAANLGLSGTNNNTSGGK